MSTSARRREFLLGSLGTIGYLSLAGCGGGSSGQGPSGIQAAADLPQMFPVSSDTLAAIRARPETFLIAYQALGGSTSTALAKMQSQLGTQFTSLTDTGAMAIYACVIACNTAPIGDTTLDPMNSTLSQLLNATTLVCGHYCKLTTLLTLIGNPQAIPPDEAQKPKLHFLVWLDDVPLNTGFHSQVLISGVLDSAYLLLDPTYGYALRLPFVGGGPQPDATEAANAAVMLRATIDQSNLAVLDPNRTASTPQMLQALLSGALGPQYVYHDSIYGCEGWDTRIAQIIGNFS